jgi:HPt (histidine-containing phosphotransfer) domain-containing protein
VPSTLPEAPAEQRPRAFHAEAALGLMDGDRELLIEIANVLLEDAPQQIELLRGAEARADFDRVAAIAHALRGAVAGVGGVGLTSELQELENAGRARDATQVARRFGIVESGWRSFEREITEWMARSEDPRS